jgi:hypothetical protein
MGYLNLGPIHVREIFGVYFYDRPRRRQKTSGR